VQAHRSIGYSSAQSDVIVGGILPSLHGGRPLAKLRSLFFVTGHLFEPIRVALEGKCSLRIDRDGALVKRLCLTLAAGCLVEKEGEVAEGVCAPWVGLEGAFVGDLRLIAAAGSPLQKEGVAADRRRSIRELRDCSEVDVLGCGAI
jgi:hypothetical protein